MVQKRCENMNANALIFNKKSLFVLVKQLGSVISEQLQSHSSVFSLRINDWQLSVAPLEVSPQKVTHGSTSLLTQTMLSVCLSVCHAPSLLLKQYFDIRGRANSHSLIFQLGSKGRCTSFSSNPESMGCGCNNLRSNLRCIPVVWQTFNALWSLAHLNAPKN